MGVVYEAVQTSLDRRVALKVLRPELADDPEFSDRFRREGRLQASLEHPHVLDVYEVGESEHGLFMSMRLVSGQTLLDLLRDGELGAERSLRLLDQVTDALDAAHEAALIHRDVKPQNVLVDEDDHAYLADFGLTRGGTETTIATSGPMLGSVAYVAPEIVRGEEPTPASDRYSFAATIFHCLTGDVVYPLGSDAAVLYAHATEPPPIATQRRPELPDALDSVFGSALAKQPEERPRTARSITGAVRDALGARADDLGSPQIVGPLDVTRDSTPIAPAATRSRPWAKVAAGACVVTVAMALAAAAALTLDDDSDAATSSSGPVVALPAIAEGAKPLGSDLAGPFDSVDCRGNAATPESEPCAIVQAELPEATLLAPADGAIVGWTVMGAQGEVALDVIRPRGAETVRVERSQWEVASNTGPNRFETALRVEAGDQIGVELAPGASIGMKSVEGATTQRWVEPTGGAFGEPDKDVGSGFDQEVALRAEFVPGQNVPLLRHLTGAAAAKAPDGKVRDTATLLVDEPRPVRLRVELVEVGGRVGVDVFDGTRRTIRVFLGGLEPGGVPIELKTVPYPGETFGEADVWWVNPSSGRMIFHFLALGPDNLEFTG
jgi:hypothetical protein